MTDGEKEKTVRIRFKWIVVLLVWAVFAAMRSAAYAEDASGALKAMLRQQVGDGCQIRETDHWLIAHKADPEWVEAAAKTLERTHDLFFEQFKKAGFEPQPLGQKLVCVLLGKQEEFVEYLERVRDSPGQPPPAKKPASEPGNAKRRVGAGSYSERTNRIQMCDIRAIVPLSNRAGDTARFERENVVRIAHEAAHQLSFNTGVLKRQVGYPPWLGEGLATNFEFSDAEKPFGPLTTNLSPRATRLKQLCADEKVMPLRQIITMSPSEARQPENRGPVYVQGWGLYRFLFTARPQQLKRYQASLADRPPGPVRRSEVLVTFEAAFGPIDEVDPEWKQFLKRL
jgi:hypothetical protein